MGLAAYGVGRVTASAKNAPGTVYAGVPRVCGQLVAGINSNHSDTPNHVGGLTGVSPSPT